MSPPSNIPWSELEAIVHHDPSRRGVASYKRDGHFLDAGQLEAAALHLAEKARSVAIITGFAVLTQRQPVAETDGPPGALYLARALRSLGVDVTLVSDTYGTPLLEVGCDLWELPRAMLAEFPKQASGDSPEVVAWIDDFLASHSDLTHLIAIERVGPSHTVASLSAQLRDGLPPHELFEREVPFADRDVCHNMRGTPIDSITAPTHWLFEAIAARGLPISTIGIGDGGNEIGLGRFPWEVLRQAISGGAGGRIICRIATDYTLLAGISNWAAYALANAVSSLRGHGDLLATWTAGNQEELITTLVQRAGAIDGLTGRHEPTVDGVPLDEYLEVWSRIHDVCLRGCENLTPSPNPSISTPLFTQHQRSFEANRFVYPVVSRRSGGISIGVNLNPDKVCNFDCIYCQVNRVQQSETKFVDLAALLHELDHMLALVTSGELFQHEKFSATPAPLRRLNDIAFSGDGEPTTYRNFDEIIAQCAEVKRRRGLDDVKLVLITNASMFHRPAVERGLATLDANQGEIWAKLEAGTEAYYKLIERTTIPFRQVLDNIAAAARVRPLVIQALFMRVNGEAPRAEELEAFCDRLSEITGAGGALKLVQIYTVARQPAESYVAPLANEAIDAIAELVRQRTGLGAAAFYGPTGD